jgi:hypothetical protein
MIRRYAVWLGLCLGSSPSAARFDRTDVAFVGMVVDLSYEQRSLPPMGVLPHTNVTFVVERALKGDVTEGERVVLRFVGGMTPEGRTTIASEVPRFSRWDRDVLFVDRTQLGSGCPLVDCERGRLRLDGDHIVSQSGLLLSELDDGQWSFVHRVDPPTGPLLTDEDRERAQLATPGRPIRLPELTDWLAVSTPASR